MKVSPLTIRIFCLASMIPAFSNCTSSSSTSSSTTAICDEIFVTDRTNSKIVVFGIGDSGDVAPKRTIVGATTKLNLPRGIVVDRTNSELIVANESGDSVLVFGLSDDGDIAPKREIVGANTTLINGDNSSVLVDATNNEIYVNKVGTNEVLVFSRTASGDVAPLRTLSSATLHTNHGMALNLANNELFQANLNTPDISQFSRTASGNTAPVRVIAGPTTTLDSPWGLTQDSSNNELWVIDEPAAGAQLTVFSKKCDGDVAPIRTITGAATTLSSPRTISVDEVNNAVYVASTGNTKILKFTRTANGDVAPLADISGANTTLGSVHGVAVNPCQ